MVSDDVTQPGNADQVPANADPAAAVAEKPQLLYLSSHSDQVAALEERLQHAVQVIPAVSSLQAFEILARGKCWGVFTETPQFLAAFESGQLAISQRILQQMPDGVLLLNAENKIVWSNGRLAEWLNRKDILGQDFFVLMDDPDIIGTSYSPFYTALTTQRPCVSTLRCSDGRCFRVHAAPVLEGEGTPQHLVVTVRDITTEYQEQQKLASIHQAGLELADLTPDEVSDMDFRARIELLKDNILHCTQDVLQFDVVEVRMLDRQTGLLEPLLAVGMKPEAESRQLRAGVQANGVTGFVAATGKSYLCEDTSKDNLYLEGSQGARSSITVPLILHDEVIGTFNVESPEINAFTESDLQFLEIFCRDVAVALNTLELLAAEQATTAAASVEAIHRAVARPVDDILNDAVTVMERYIGHEPAVVERLQHILRNARDIKQVIHQVGQSLAPAEARLSGSRAEQRPKLVGKHVLVVDEDQSVRSAAHALLDRYQCVVETAHDGNEAIFMLRNLNSLHQYDAILADIRLPDMSGYQLMVKLSEMMDRVPIILMTGFGYDPGHSIVKARQAGLKHVLYKPFRLDQLLETVEQVVS